MKQSAIDPLSGKIDISILTTGMSLAARKRRQELVETLKKLIKGKDKTPTLNYQKIFMELKESSSMVSLFVICVSHFMFVLIHFYLYIIIMYFIMFILFLICIIQGMYAWLNLCFFLVGDARNVRRCSERLAR